MDRILSEMNLPNLHPAIVHFPIVLLLIAFLIDVAAIWFYSKDWLRKMALLLFVLGAVFAGITFWSGKQASHTVMLTSQAEPVLSEHEQLAEYTLWFFGIYVAIRLALHFFTTYRRPLHAVMIVLALPGIFLLFETAEHGGILVYKHGIGVKAARQSSSNESPNVSSNEAAAATPAPSRAIGPGPTIQQNRIEWLFQPGSDQHFNEALQPAIGNLQSLKISTGQDGNRTALILNRETADPLVLVFPNPYDDVQIEAEVDTHEFNGEFGLVHHQSGQNYDFVSLNSGQILLGRRDGANEKIFDSNKIGGSQDWLNLKAVSSGQHFRGYVNGKMLAHGHAEPAATGKVGILLKGIGTVRIARILVEPISQKEE
jgi:uncharacterized membrane protein